MSEVLSCGQQIFHGKKLQQASCFLANHVPQEKREAWLNSLPKSNLRTNFKKFKETVLCVVLSQNCDIACNQDQLDDSIEIALCQVIKPKNLFPGNQFVKSVRKLQFEFEEKCYEASVDYIITVSKKDLLEVMSNPDFELKELHQDIKQSFPFWRANRYVRSALPDKFNEQIGKILDKYLNDLDTISSSIEKESFSSYIKAFYVNLDSLEEKDQYEFEFFFLMRDETPDILLTKIQDVVTDFADNLVIISNNNYTDVSMIYADRESNTNVRYISELMRFNVDYFSLRSGDTDFEANVA